MPIQVEVISITPCVFDNDTRFMALGKLKSHGDIFIPFVSLETGKFYVEEAFAANVGGQHLTGLQQVKSDEVWNALVDSCQKHKLCHPRYIADCIKKEGATIPLVAAQTLAGPNPQDLQYIKQLGIIK